MGTSTTLKSAGGHMQPRRLLEIINDNFLTQMIEKPMRRGIWLNLILTNKEGVVGNMKVKGSLGCPDHEMESRILKGGSRSKSKITNLDFRRTDFSHFKDLLEESHGIRPWWEEVSSRKLLDIQEYPPRAAHQAGNLAT
ncbi:mast stem cell growth factor receptor kit [Limosa lapponica baueri]|uniref:Mast stem cell growth factor receptor kit n=1 Tax=Limosa lapponica baueri TaxID=1758121 RepID=A0A2I0UGE5_LIMLA|nr:mast stem cell growth factor receptor kit [Limosa lapponica baueri]